MRLITEKRWHSRHVILETINKQYVVSISQKTDAQNQLVLGVLEYYSWYSVTIPECLDFLFSSHFYRLFSKYSNWKIAQKASVYLFNCQKIVNAVRQTSLPSDLTGSWCRTDVGKNRLLNFCLVLEAWRGELICPNVLLLWRLQTTAITNGRPHHLLRYRIPSTRGESDRGIPHPPSRYCP